MTNRRKPQTPEQLERRKQKQRNRKLSAEQIEEANARRAVESREGARQGRRTGRNKKGASFQRKAKE